MTQGQRVRDMEIEAAQARVTLRKGRVDSAMAALRVAALEGRATDAEEAAVDAAVEEMDRVMERMMELVKSPLPEERVSKTTDAFAAAKDKMMKGLGGALAALKVHEARREEFPVAYYEKERGRLLTAAQTADSEAVAATMAAQAEGFREARRLRAKAEAEALAHPSYPAYVAAKADLANDPRSGEAFVGMARDALNAGQAKLADLYLGVAAKKGTKVSPLDPLPGAVREALDLASPDVKAARDVEASTAKETEGLLRARLVAARDSGLGITREGELGSGASGQASIADSTSKVRDYMARVESGEVVPAPAEGQ